MVKTDLVVLEKKMLINAQCTTARRQTTTAICHLSDLGDLNMFTDYLVLLESLNLVKILVTLAEKIVMSS